MKTVAAIFVALVLLASAKTGLCQDNAKPAESRSWYGFQILLADGLSYAAILGSLSSHSSSGAIAGLGGYLVASPVVHGLNHQPRNLARSVIMRLVVPVTTYVVARGMASSSGGENTAMEKTLQGFLGMAIGMVAVTVVDSALAWKSRSPQPVPSPPSDSPKTQNSITLASVGVVPTPNGASLVLGGQF
jgi:hypothetical protein